jgi:biotin carboxyl carrier protein
MAKYEVSVDGKQYEVEIVRDDGRKATLNVDGREYTIEARNVSAPGAGGAGGGGGLVAAPERAKAPPPAAGGGSGQISAPLAGLVLEVCVSVGQSVAAGDVLCRVEAMKMENDIQASAPGTVKDVLVAQGDEVQEGQALMTLEG